VCERERESVCGIPEAKVVMAKLLNWLERKVTMELRSRNGDVRDIEITLQTLAYNVFSFPVQLIL
jgi:hypothetical protein